jgi:hypothetical protein
VNSIIKHGILREGKVFVVAVGGIPGEIEVTNDDPRDIIARLVSSEVRQKIFFFSAITGGIDVGETETRGVAVKHKVERESVAGGERVYESKNIMVPSREETTRGSHRIDGTVVAGIGRKEEAIFWAERELSLVSCRATRPGLAAARSAQTEVHLSSSPSPRTFQVSTAKQSVLIS